MAGTDGLYFTVSCKFEFHISSFSPFLLTEQETLSADSQPLCWTEIHLTGQLLSTQLGLSEYVGENEPSFSVL